MHNLTLPKMSFSARLRLAMLSSECGAIDLERRIDEMDGTHIDAYTIAQYADARIKNPPSDDMLVIARALQVNENWFVNGEPMDLQTALFTGTNSDTEKNMEKAFNHIQFLMKYAADE